MSVGGLPAKQKSIAGKQLSLFRGRLNWQAGRKAEGERDPSGGDEVPSFVAVRPSIQPRSIMMAMPSSRQGGGDAVHANVSVQLTSRASCRRRRGHKHGLQIVQCSCQVHSGIISSKRRRRREGGYHFCTGGAAAGATGLDITWMERQRDRESE